MEFEGAEDTDGDADIESAGVDGEGGGADESPGSDIGGGKTAGAIRAPEGAGNHDTQEANARSHRSSDSRSNTNKNYGSKKRSKRK
jgi:hypothetical protein